MTEQEKQEAGITAELESRGSFNASPQSPPSPPPAPPKEPEKKPAEPEPEAPPKDGKPPEQPPDGKGEANKVASRLRARLAEMREIRRKTLEKLAAAKGDAAVEAVHAAKIEELGIEEAGIASEQARAYFAKMAEAFPDKNSLEQVAQYAAKYTPRINEAAPEFADWWAEQPRHFESLAMLYLAFASKKLSLDDFLDWTDWDKKQFVGNLLKCHDEKAQAAKPPPEAPKAANGQPLPKVDGEPPKAGDPDDMQALYDRRRAQAAKNFVY